MKITMRANFELTDWAALHLAPEIGLDRYQLYGRLDAELDGYWHGVKVGGELVGDTWHLEYVDEDGRFDEAGKPVFGWVASVSSSAGKAQEV